MKSYRGFLAFSKLMRNARVYRIALFSAVLGLLLTRLGEGAIYKYIIPQTLDEGFIARQVEFMSYMPAMFIGIFVAIGSGEFLSKYCMGYVGRSVVRDYRLEMLAHLLLVPMDYYKRHGVGELISKLNYDAEQVAIAVSDAVREFLNSIVAIVVLFGVMVSISWRITLVILLIAPVFILILRMLGMRMRRYSVRVQDSMGAMTHVSAEVIAGYQEIRIFQGQDYELQRIRNAVEYNWHQELRTFLIAGLSSPIMQLFGGIILVGFIFLVMFQGVNLTPGQIFGLIGVLFALIRPLKQMSAVNNVMQKGIAAIESIDRLLATPIESDIGTIIKNERPNKLEFTQVSFAYPDNPEVKVLDRINFSVARGETLAIVGASGSGKSSLISLIPKFYHPSNGKVLLDGQDIAELDLNSLRSHLAIITQNVVLFNDTVANNIAYGRRDISRDKIREAARIANALEFIEQLPQGFDTLVGENGCLLSGGQRQRLAIARAVLKDAGILILDEATSALDNESELAIKLALNNLMRDRINIVIAHRLSTVEQATRIMVLEHGRVVEIGAHEELLALSGRYAQLYRAQLVQEKVM